MSMEYIRNHYKVPAKRGAKVRFTDCNGKQSIGTIRSARGAYLRCHFPDHPERLHTIHPTWHVEYLPSNSD